MNLDLKFISPQITVKTHKVKATKNLGYLRACLSLKFVFAAV
ncbi:hypothetical protein PFLA_a3004 [Pseudoalteromonas flavipulchra NCIMB 2033 = ATCC BAA-314]|nr:hypothetical protein [Pseudoalteromonas flavipulchra NCIMB 2033 = ATCC BAA-314]